MGPGSHTQWSSFRGSNEESYGSRQSYMTGLQDKANQMIKRRFGPALKGAGAEHEVRIRICSAWTAAASQTIASLGRFGFSSSYLLVAAWKCLRGAQSSWKIC